MADVSLFQRLSKLFSTNVVIRQVDGKLKVNDTESIQSYSDLSTNFMKSRGMAYFHSTAARYGYDIMANISAQRITIFRDYELMDQDPITASALDIYSSSCSAVNEFGEIITIKSDNEKVKNALENLFYDILNIEYNLYPWIRCFCKYGDHFLKLEIAEKYGIINVVPVSPYEIQREEGFDPENPYKVRFKLQQVGSDNSEMQAYEIAHFRNLSDNNYLPYGRSVIEPARRVWKQLMLMEDAMLIHRIMRAPEHRIFKIDIGNIPPNEQETYIKGIVNKMKKVPYIDPKTGDYNLRFNMQNMTEDVFMPIRGGDSGTSIDTLAGLEYNAIDDINYLLNKYLAALKIPKAFLGYEESLGGKAVLAAEDVRFSDTIQRIQKLFTSELTKIAIIHLYVQGFKDDEITDFELSLTNPSTIAEQERVALWQSKISLTRDIMETKLFDKEWVYKNVWNMTDVDIKERQEKILKDIKTNFRYAQIENEGNDPFLTNQTFGTPHDLVVLQQKAREANNNVESKKLDFSSSENNFKLNYDNDADSSTVSTEKDPENDYGQQNHALGRDALGKDSYHQSNKLDTSLKPTYRKSPLSMEGKKRLGLDLIIKKSKEMIHESLNIEKTVVQENSDEGTYLDENNLINI